MDEESKTVVEPEVEQEVKEETLPVEESEKKEETQPPEENKGEEEANDLVVTFGDEETPPQDNEHQEAPEWVKQLRKDNKETAKENKKLKKQLEEIAGTKKETETLTLGDKPTLENSDYDEDVYQKNMDAYYDRRNKIAEQSKQAEEQVKTQQVEGQKVFDNYAQKKESLKVKDYQTAEDNVVEALSGSMQDIILTTALDPAKVVYALGNNEAKLKELSAIKDPYKFAATLARMETTLKTSNRKKAPAPEKKVIGGSGNLGTNDKTFDKLKEDAYTSGDFTKFNAYKKQIKKEKAK